MFRLREACRAAIRRLNKRFGEIQSDKIIELAAGRPGGRRRRVADKDRVTIKIGRFIRAPVPPVMALLPGRNDRDGRIRQHGCRRTGATEMPSAAEQTDNSGVVADIDAMVAFFAAGSQRMRMPLMVPSAARNESGLPGTGNPAHIHSHRVRQPQRDSG